ETREPADSHAYKENDDGAFQYLHAGGVAELEVVFLQGNVCGNSHDKHEEGKDEVGGGQTVPLCMPQGGIDMSPRTGVVYHNHTCDGDTTENVECKDAFTYFCTVHCNICVLS